MSKFTRFMLIACGSALFFMVLVYVYVAQSRVVGFEFNSQTWQIRHFEFYADPFTNKELVGIDRTGKVMWTVDPRITAILPTRPSANERWDLIELDDYQAGISEGPAAILVNALTARKSGWSSVSIEFWSNWTTEHPKEAASLWKAVQSLTVHGAYNDVPKLLELAVTSTPDIPALSDQFTADALARRAQKLQTEGEVAAAKAAATDGLNYAPNSMQLKKIAEGS